ncbi:hypothetical protein Fmac_012439 [Flemingia macrophylla]|uniref:Uncharacterized protein n=1 Tax=Flemingia macrophylla TaxID=520843 RepID=A0ABD1MQ98_9FABA
MEQLIVEKDESIEEEVSSWYLPVFWFSHFIKLYLFSALLCSIDFLFYIFTCRHLYALYCFQQISLKC